jgi:hypothetical protein
MRVKVGQPSPSSPGVSYREGKTATPVGFRGCYVGAGLVGGGCGVLGVGVGAAERRAVLRNSRRPTPALPTYIGCWIAPGCRTDGARFGVTRSQQHQGEGEALLAPGASPSGATRIRCQAKLPGRTTGSIM